MMSAGKTFIISRTDGIGDVVLSLPLAGIIKKEFPGSRVIFLGKAYTEDVVSCSMNVDAFVDWEKLNGQSLKDKAKYFMSINADVIIHVYPVKEIAKVAKKAKIPLRIGAINRLFNWTTCNFLPYVSRRRSDLHEAQLNIKLLKPIVSKTDYDLEELTGYYGLKQMSNEFKLRKLIDNTKINLILHPKSKGSAREWGDHNFSKLIEILDKEKFNIFVCGTENEGFLFREVISKHYYKITDLTGKLTLKEYIHFIFSCDALVACSTGPLHIAAAFGIHAIGLYPPIRPVHPGRWSAIGKNVKIFVKDNKCTLCRNKDYCKCMDEISPESVMNYLNMLYEQL